MRSEEFRFKRLRRFVSWQWLNTPFPSFFLPDTVWASTKPKDKRNRVSDFHRNSSLLIPHS